jgi:DNA-binding MarR family transcriptional regulator
LQEYNRLFAQSAVRVYLTEAGREAMEHKHRELLRMMADDLQALGEADTYELLRIAGRLAEIHQSHHCCGEDTANQ